MASRQRMRSSGWVLAPPTVWPRLDLCEVIDPDRDAEPQVERRAISSARHSSSAFANAAKTARISLHEESGRYSRCSLPIVAAGPRCFEGQPSGQALLSAVALRESKPDTAGRPGDPVQFFIDHLLLPWLTGDSHGDGGRGVSETP
jgi:hypothetical protein